MLSSAKLSEMTGDFEIEQKTQLCDFGVDPNRSNESSEDSPSKQHFNFPGSFQSNCSKSGCRGDVSSEKIADNDGNMCLQGLVDQTNAPNRVSSNSPYCSEQLHGSTTSDPIESTIESIKTLTLESSKQREAPFRATLGDSPSFAFERSHSAQKFDCYPLLGDATQANTNAKSRSTPESSSGMDSAYASGNPLNQLLIENQSSTYDSHVVCQSGPYWGNPGNGQADDADVQNGLSLNNLSPLLTNLLFQQSSNASASPNNGLQANALSSSTVPKRAITGGHQNVRPTQLRPPGWNPVTTSTFESNFMTTASDQSVFNPPTTAGLPTSKPPGWMGSFSSQSSSGSYPWSSGQQGSFKPAFNDMTPSGYPTGNGMRFGMNANFSNVVANGFPKGPTSSNQASLYSMFPKRPTHRMMAHWQQQQQHQQLQQLPGSIVNKQHSSDFSSPSPYGTQDGVSSVLSQKIQQGQFGQLGSNAGGNSLSNNLMGSSAEVLGSEKMSGLDSFRGNFGMDQHMFEFMKPMESPGNAPPAVLDDLTVNSIPGMENYHSNLHSAPNMQHSRSGIMPPGMQNQGIHAINNAYSGLSGVPPREEGYSRKVFVGGLPPDIDEEEITTAFRRFGALIVDWPHKTESKAYFPPKGYCFLLFQEEQSVQDLISACIVDEGKYYWCVSSPTMKDKPVQIRPWNLADSDFVMDGSQPLDPRKTIFVGGVPRPLRAIELALIMDRLYGGVCYAGIDIDPELKYPKGAGRVAFSNQQSYIAAISARFVQLQHNDIDKRVEVKPYVLDNQMCDECQGARCGGKFAPLFCANVTCLQYYCEQCWIQIHSRQGREYHKPLVKEGAERPRPALYRW